MHAAATANPQPLASVHSQRSGQNHSLPKPLPDKIPIDGKPLAASRGFVLRRLSDAGPFPVLQSRQAGIRNPSRNRPLRRASGRGCSKVRRPVTITPPCSEYPSGRRDGPSEIQSFPRRGRGRQRSPWSSVAICLCWQRRYQAPPNAATAKSYPHPNHRMCKAPGTISSNAEPPRAVNTPFASSIDSWPTHILEFL
jgi:hypothetical protein